MLVKSALISGLAITAAQAFLVTPDAAPAGGKASLENFPFLADVADQTVELSCPGCPVRAVAEDSLAGPPLNHLEMAFSVDRSDHGDRLLVNGFELYPNPDPFTNPLTAPQVLDEPSRDAADPESMSLGYKLQVVPIAVKSIGASFERDFDFIRVDLQIIEVGGAFVNGIPSVQVDLIKLGDDLSIAKITTVESIGNGCATLFCKFKAMFTKNLSSFKKPCPGKMGHGMGHGMEHGMHGRPAVGMPQGGPPRPHHPHGSQEPGRFRHHHGGHVFGFLIMIVTHVLLPIILGIFAGVVTGLVGMAILSVILTVMRVIRGKKSQAPPSYKAVPTEITVGDDEKDGFMEDQEHVDPPPSYGENAAPPRT